MTSVLGIVTTVCAGLLIGTEFSVSAFVNPVLWQLEGSAQARAISLFARRLGTAMPFWYAITLLLLIVEAFVRRHEPGSVFLIVASVIWLAVILLTLVFLVPINNEMARLGEAFSEEGRRRHKRWDSLHRLRVLTLGVASVCFLLAA